MPMPNAAERRNTSHLTRTSRIDWRMEVDGDELRDTGAGYTIVENAIPVQVAEELVAAIENAARGTEYEEAPYTKRVLDVLDFAPDLVGRVLDALPTRGLESVLGEHFRIGSLHAHGAYPVGDVTSSEENQDFRDYALHIDYPFWLDDMGEASDETILPGAPISVQGVVFLTPFSEENGGTLVVPGSHAWRRMPERVPRGETDRPGRDVVAPGDAQIWENQAVPMQGSAGDVLYYSGQTWHGTGINMRREGEGVRWALLIQFLPYFYTPLEPLTATTPARVLDPLPPKARNLLGLAPEAEAFPFPRRIKPRPLSRTLGWALHPSTSFAASAISIGLVSAAAIWALARRGGRGGGGGVAVVGFVSSVAAFVSGAHLAFRSVGR